MHKNPLTATLFVRLRVSDEQEARKALPEIEDIALEAALRQRYGTENVDEILAVHKRLP